MSSITECSAIASVFIGLRLKWVLKVKELEALSSKDVSVIHSNLYKFKTINDLNFCLSLEHPEIWYYELSVKGSKKWSFQMMNPFILIKERAYGLKPFNKQKFLEVFDYCCIPNEEEYVIHCVVNICPVSPILHYHRKPFFLEGQGTVQYESLPYLTLPSSCTNEKVIAFIQKGDFPDLNVDVAIQIIYEAKIHKCDVLKILCIEYLKKNVTEDSFEKILKVAKDFKLQHLELACTVTAGDISE